MFITNKWMFLFWHWGNSLFLFFQGKYSNSSIQYFTHVWKKYKQVEAGLFHRCDSLFHIGAWREIQRKYSLSSHLILSPLKQCFYTIGDPWNIFAIFFKFIIFTIIRTTTSLGMLMLSEDMLIEGQIKQKDFHL